MSSLLRVFLALALSLVAIALVALPAQAQQCAGRGIELVPASGPPGTKVIVYGRDFAAGKLVQLYYNGNPVATGKTSSNGAFTILITIPEQCQGQYRVLAKVGTTWGGTMHVDTYFTVTPGLAVSPESGIPGTTVTVKGQGFACNEGEIELLYYLDGRHETVISGIQANAKGSWETSFLIPPSNRGQHKIDAQGKVTRFYQVKDAIFTVTAGIRLDKSSGVVGDNVSMTGSTFTPYEKGIRIFLGGQVVATDIRADANGEWQASFRVPEMPAGTYDITAEGDRTKRQDVGHLSFEIKPYVVLSSSEGHVGMNLTITGTGFAAAQDVVIQYDGETVVTVESSELGSFEANFLVPESIHGVHLVVARDDSGNAFTAVFTMESNHPAVPTLISPSNNGRVGFLGKVTPTLRWSEVADDSGVHYSLQIATSPTVTSTGEFADPLIAHVGLVGTSYTLNATEALRNGIYYWIVKAVDGAENESGWTRPRSFRAGLMPVWGFVLLVVGIVVLIGLLIRALLRRRALYDDWW